MSALVPSSAAVSIDGGLSRNCYFTQFLADVLEREVRVADNAELTGTGTARLAALACGRPVEAVGRSEEQTSEIQSLKRISHDVFCLKKQTITKNESDTTKLTKPNY